MWALCHGQESKAADGHGHSKRHISAYAEPCRDACRLTGRANSDNSALKCTELDLVFHADSHPERCEHRASGRDGRTVLGGVVSAGRGGARAACSDSISAVRKVGLCRSPAHSATDTGGKARVPGKHFFNLL